MSHELSSVKLLAPVFYERLGDERQESLYRRAIVIAEEQSRPDVAQQARAWLSFSMGTREFAYRVQFLECRAKRHLRQKALQYSVLLEDLHDEMRQHGLEVFRRICY